MRRLGIDARELTRKLTTGIGRFIVEILRAASRDGWDCVAYSDRPAAAQELPVGLSSVVMPAPCTVWWDQVRLPRQLARDRISVFLSPYYKGPLMASCPVVVTIHDLFFIGYLGRRRLFYDAAATVAARLYARRASLVLTDSEHSRREVVARLGISPEHVVSIPIALSPAFHPTPMADSVRRRYGLGPSYVLYVGNAKPHKNLAALLRAFAELPDAVRADHQLAVAGHGTDVAVELRRLARDLGVADRVAFVGSVEDSDLPAIYSAAIAFVLPSLEEGFGLPALEAMACGAPVVASNRTSLPEVVGDAGILVAPDDHAAIAEAVARVLSSPELRRDLRRRGLDRAAEFSPARTSERVLEVLERVSKTTPLSRVP